MKKKIILLIYIFLCTIISIKEVKAENTTNFQKDEFIKYFEKRNFEIKEMECLPDPNYNLECKLIYATHPANNKGVGLHIFENEEKAYDYFKYIYYDNEKEFTNPEIYNLEKELDSNYSYVKTVLSDLHYFYMVTTDKYLIKSNIEIEKADFMNKIYDDLGFIEEKEKSNKIVPLLLLISIILIIVIIYLFIKNKEKIKLKKLT